MGFVARRRGRFMVSLADKHVLVTGAATGIGRATAEYLGENGAKVFGIGLDGAPTSRCRQR
jgi:NAD(P)-dependent dehydrogenase (short-subunit alcohol dehydrogenase family)